MKISPVSLTPPPANVDFAPLAALLERLAPGAPLSYEQMPGGASSRRYFRVYLRGAGVREGALEGASRTSVVAMFVPEGGRAEEVQREATIAGRWPFLEVRELLSRAEVDVPALVAEDCERGWLVLEDLGEDTLANYLLRHPEEKSALYTRAARGLAIAQGALGSLAEGSLVGSRAFDEELLRWEIHHFREWGLEARGRRLSEGAGRTFDAIADRLAARIASWPRGFTHRDYQSRNLMVRPGGGLVWIDFQDALMGPRIYDLVSLLTDSYQSFERSFVEARLDDYAEVSGASHADLLREFDYVTVQRKLKDAGRFVFIDRVKHNPSFLRFVAPTVRKVRDALARLGDDADMRALAAILQEALPDEA